MIELATLGVNVTLVLLFVNMSYRLRAVERRIFHLERSLKYGTATQKQKGAIPERAP